MDLTKAALRREIRQLLRRLSSEARVEGSRQAADRLRAEPVWKEAERLAAFVPRADELDIEPLLREWLGRGRALLLPRFAPETGRYELAEVGDWDHDLAAGNFGIREPVRSCPTATNKPLDLVLVPGLAFDVTGRRLGRGKGFYDRLLLEITGRFCGVAFDGQIVREVPVDPHDQRLDFILTPTRWIACGACAV